MAAALTLRVSIEVPKKSDLVSQYPTNLQPLQEHVEHGDLPEGGLVALARHGLEGRRAVVVWVVLQVLLPPPRVLPDAGLFPVNRLLVVLKGIENDRAKFA